MVHVVAQVYGAPHFALLLCFAAAAADLCAAPVPRVDPAIARADVFVAARYDADTALVFFHTASIAGSPGVPAGPWPQTGVAVAWVTGTHLQLAPAGEEKQWASQWPGGPSFAPQIGEEFVLATGGSARVRGMLGSLGYLPDCNQQTWLVGLVRVDAVDRADYATANAEGMAAYPATPETVQRILQTHAAVAPAATSTTADGRIVNRFSLEALPMLDRGAGAEETMLLIEEDRPEGVLFSFKRQTPTGELEPVGVYFARSCRAGSNAN